MTISGSCGALSGYWNCADAAGPLSGACSGSAVSLDLKSSILLYPLHVTATLDGGSLRGSVQAPNYDRHEFLAGR
jgi:hypothetical protein